LTESVTCLVKVVMNLHRVGYVSHRTAHLTSHTVRFFCFIFSFRENKGKKCSIVDVNISHNVVMLGLLLCSMLFDTKILITIDVRVCKEPKLCMLWKRAC